PVVSGRQPDRGRTLPRRWEASGSRSWCGALPRTRAAAPGRRPSDQRAPGDRARPRTTRRAPPRSREARPARLPTARWRLTARSPRRLPHRARRRRPADAEIAVAVRDDRLGAGPLAVSPLLLRRQALALRTDARRDLVLAGLAARRTPSDARSARQHDQEAADQRTGHCPVEHLSALASTEP